MSLLLEVQAGLDANLNHNPTRFDVHDFSCLPTIQGPPIPKIQTLAHLEDKENHPPALQTLPIASRTADASFLYLAHNASVQVKAPRVEPLTFDRNEPEMTSGPSLSIDFAFEPLELDFASPSITPQSHHFPSQLAQPSLRRRRLKDLSRLPALSHRNSPYVPWSPSTRREIMQHKTHSNESFVLSVYSRPHSRSGARAPEPHEPDCVTRTGWKRTKVIGRIRKFRRLFHKRVSSVASQISSFTATPSRITDRQLLIRLPHEGDHGVLPSARSTVSMESSHTNSLDLWLASRQASNEDGGAGNSMTIEDYELYGSWIQDPNGYAHDSHMQHASSVSAADSCRNVEAACLDHVFSLSGGSVESSHHGGVEIVMPGGWISP